MSKAVKVGLANLVGCCVAASVGGLAVLQSSTSAPAADEAMVKRGEYLTRAGDCFSCHTEPGGKPFAGGAYLQTPVGAIAPPNITPDKETGIGNWTDDEFYRALHEGIGRSSEYLYPAFPFPWFTKITRDDALAVKAYLFSLPAEHAPPKPLKMAFPFNNRLTLLAWRTAFFKPGTFVPDPQRNKEVNRGAYLVEGLGHCGACHNRNNVYGASDWSGRLQGGQVEGWYAPDITSDGHEGIGSWSEDQLAAFFKSGAAPGKGLALGPMREVIDDSLRHLSDEDLHAMAAYLKSTTPAPSYRPATEAAAQSGAPRSAQLYLSFCAYCHLPDGRGLPGAVAALAGNGIVRAQGPEDVIRVVLGGIQATHGFAPMPAVGAAMSDSDVAAVVNYVRTAWGNGAPANAHAGLVAELRGQTHTVLAGNPVGGCPSIANPQLAQVIERSEVGKQLKDTPVSEVLGHIDAILAPLKASGANSDEIVNALTAAYCRVVLADASLSPTERTSLLGSFSGLAYGEIKRDTKPN